MKQKFDVFEVRPSIEQHLSEVLDEKLNEWKTNHPYWRIVHFQVTKSGPWARVIILFEYE